MKPKQEPDIAQLLSTHRRLIYKVASSYCPEPDEQEDLIQEIILQIIRAYPKFDHRVKLTTWMYKIALNVSISHYRKVKTRQKYILPMPEKPVQVEHTQEVFESEALSRLKLLTQALDPLNRALLLLYLDGHSHQEMAETMGMSVTNVGTKINRIKNQLKQNF